MALDCAFTTLGLGDICSLPQVGNLASVRVVLRLGLRHERDIALPATDRPGRGLVVTSLYVITATEWLGRDAS